MQQKLIQQQWHFFGIVEEIFNFFAASIYRWDILKKNITQLTLKPLSNTQWSSRIDALNSLRYLIKEIYDALFEIAEDDSKENITRNEATTLCRKLKDFQFLCSSVLWQDLLNRINTVSKMLQSSSINIAVALTALENLVNYLENFRFRWFWKIADGFQKN